MNERIGHRFVCSLKWALTVWASALSICPLAANAAQDAAIRAKLVHVFIRADVNEVVFDNIWVFERAEAGESWRVEVELPQGASDVHLDEPESSAYSNASRIVSKAIAPDSLIDSVGFSYVLDNADGECSLRIVSRYPVELIVASVSGPATGFASNLLDRDEERQLRSRFSGVYTAEDIAADGDISIELFNLPTPGSGMLEKVCAAGLAVIVAAALVTALLLKRAETRRSETDGG